MCFLIVSIIFIVGIFTPVQSSIRKSFESNDIQQNNPVPVVLWHGLGDSCCNPMSIGGIKTFLEQNIPNVYVNSLEIGKNELTDLENSYLLNSNKQISEACRLIAADENLKDGYNAIGFSQGGQFLRAVVQRCPHPQMKTLVSFGGQHQGVYGFPRCPGESGIFCDYIRKILNEGAYTEWVQNHLAPAGYWHDPLNEDEYKSKSIFLADVNNENVKNETYKANLQKLENFVMVKFMNDTIVDPKETEWFGFYKPGQSKDIVALQNSTLYIEDWLGLQEMDKQNKLHFYEVPGNHLEIDLDWFKKEIIDKFFK